MFKRLVCEHFPHLTEYLEGLGADVSCVFVQVGRGPGTTGDASAGSACQGLSGWQLVEATYLHHGPPLCPPGASQDATP